MLALALTIATAVAASEFGTSIDRALDAARFRLSGHAASGQVVVVELDAASAAAIKRWPWPRDHYARLLDQLVASGAATVTFDVDFSSPSTSDGDAAFAASLARSRGIVALPTFAQRARSGDHRGIDSLPLPIFRDHATMASVSVAPDNDGLVRLAPFGTITAGTPRPSISAYTAGRSGVADTFFPVDFGIDPKTIPRLSFVDVRDGRFARAVVRGKSVIVGATAIEMGDRYAVPRWGVIPGVIVQALATETLKAGIPRQGNAAVMLALATIAAAALLWLGRRWQRIAAAIAGPGLVFGVAVIVQFRWGIALPLAGALTLCLVATIGAIGLEIVQRFDQQRQTDDVSGLPNRTALSALRRAAPDTDVAVLHVGNWEALITVLGSEAERDLIVRIADRLRLGAVDQAVYRIGDRLLAFAPTAGDEAALAGLRAILLQPIEVAGRFVDAKVALGTSTGRIDSALSQAALAAEDAHREGAFLKRAHADLERLDRDVSLMGELDQAIRRGEIEIHCQPKLHLASGRIVSCEALVRWRHPTRGFIRPDLFIPLAEQADRIEDLTLHVLSLAIDTLADWLAKGHDLTIAVNISARLVTAPGFNTRVNALLIQQKVPANSLIFEVTESATLSEPEAAAAALTRYRDLGIAISMDDYGTGQSTLSYLRNLPLTELKIDRSFVQNAHVNRNDGLLVRSTIELAHAMGLKVVAEGVEEEGCLQFLREAGCDLVQGYLISRPVPALQFLGQVRPRSKAA